jgi:hypothetical protein
MSTPLRPINDKPLRQHTAAMPAVDVARLIRSDSANGWPVIPSPLTPAGNALRKLRNCPRCGAPLG